MNDAMIEATDTITIASFPADRLDFAREKLAHAHQKLLRAATKAGATVPDAPQLNVVAERVQLFCPVCKGHQLPTAVDQATLTVARDAAIESRLDDAKQFATEATTSKACPRGCRDKAPMDAYLVLDLSLTSTRPKLAGWEFLFVVEPLTGGNLIRKVPGAQALPDTTPWRTKAVSCDHCATKRRRLETFVLRATGDDPSIAINTLREVGRNCLEAFLGGLSPAMLVARLSWAKLVRDAGDYDESTGSYSHRGPRVMNPEDFMQHVAASVRADGWLSRGTVRERGAGCASADHAIYLMFPPDGGTDRERQEWRDDLARVAPNDTDRAHGIEVLTWARTLPEDGVEYTRNLRLMALQPNININPKHYGILASGINAWERAVGRVAREAKMATHSNAHVGTEGKRLEWDVTVERVADVETDYGVLHIITLRTTAGDALIWKTTTKRMEIGWTGRLCGTVKRHSEYRGQKQTELSRCSIVEPKAAKAPRAPRGPRKAKGAAPSSEDSSATI